jgi:hypothetical protein
MHIHDAHRITLLPVGGSEEQAPSKAQRRQSRSRGGKPRKDCPGQAQEAARIGESMQGAPWVSPTRGRGNNGTCVHPVTLADTSRRLKAALAIGPRSPGNCRWPLICPRTSTGI